MKRHAAKIKRVGASATAIFGIVIVFVFLKPNQLISGFLAVIASIAIAISIFSIPNGEDAKAIKSRKNLPIRIVFLVIGIGACLTAYFINLAGMNTDNNNTTFEEVNNITPTSFQTIQVFAYNTPEPETMSPLSTETLPTPTIELVFTAQVMEAYQVGRDYFDDNEYEDAYQFLLIAAQAGHSNAQLYTGRCLQEGVRVDDEATSASEWFLLAANQGNDQAQYELGRCYFGGDGVVKNYETAFYWFNESAKHENSNGLLWVGYCYHHGLGVKQDYELANEYYIMARDKGQSYAQRRIEELQNDMNSEE